MNRLTSAPLPPIKEEREEFSPDIIPCTIRNFKEASRNLCHNSLTSSPSCYKESPPAPKKCLQTKSSDWQQRLNEKTYVESSSGRKIESSTVIKQQCLNNTVDLPKNEQKPTIHSQTYYSKVPKYGAASVDTRVYRQRKQRERFAQCLKQRSTGGQKSNQLKTLAEAASCLAERADENYFRQSGAHVKPHSQPLGRTELFHNYGTYVTSSRSSVEDNESLIDAFSSQMDVRIPKMHSFQVDNILNVFTKTRKNALSPLLGSERPTTETGSLLKGVSAGIRLNSKKMAKNWRNNGFLEPIQSMRRDPCLDAKSFSRLIVHNQDMTHKYLREWEKSQLGTDIDDLLEQTVPFASPSSSVSSFSEEELMINSEGDLKLGSALKGESCARNYIGNNEEALQICADRSFHMYSMKGYVSTTPPMCNDADEKDATSKTGHVSAEGVGEELRSQPKGSISAASMEVYIIPVDSKRSERTTPLQDIYVGKEISSLIESIRKAPPMPPSRLCEDTQSDVTVVKSLREQLDKAKLPTESISLPVQVNTSKPKKTKLRNSRKKAAIMKKNPMFAMDFIDGWSVGEKQSQSSEEISIGTSGHLHPVDESQTIHISSVSPGVRIESDHRSGPGEPADTCEDKCEEKTRGSNSNTPSHCRDYENKNSFRDDDDVLERKKTKRKKGNKLQQFDSFKTRADIIKMRLSESNETVKSFEQACRDSKRLLGQLGRFDFEANEYLKYTSSINLTEKLTQQLRNLGKDKTANRYFDSSKYQSYSTNSRHTCTHLGRGIKESSSERLPRLSDQCELTHRKKVSLEGNDTFACEIHLRKTPTLPRIGQMRGGSDDEEDHEDNVEAVLKFTSRNEAMRILPPLTVKQLQSSNKSENDNKSNQLDCLSARDFPKSVPLRVESLSSPYMFDQGNPEYLCLKANSLPSWNNASKNAEEKVSGKRHQDGFEVQPSLMAALNENLSHYDGEEGMYTYRGFPNKVKPKHIRCLQGRSVDVPEEHKGSNGPCSVKHAVKSDTYVKKEVPQISKNQGPPKTEDLSFSFMDQNIRVTFSCPLDKHERDIEKEFSQNPPKSARDDRKENVVARETRIYTKKKPDRKLSMDELDRKTMEKGSISSPYLEFCKRKALLRQAKGMQQAELLLRYASDTSIVRKSKLPRKQLARHYSSPSFPSKKMKDRLRPKRIDSKSMTRWPSASLGIKGDKYQNIKALAPESVYIKHASQPEVDIGRKVPEVQVQDVNSRIIVHIPSSDNLQAV